MHYLIICTAAFLASGLTLFSGSALHAPVAGDLSFPIDKALP
jgi:hypothetical protein